MPQRTVVVVGPQGQQQANATVLLIDRSRQGVKESPRRRLVGLSEQLLELIDEDEQLRLFVGQDSSDRTRNTELVSSQLLEEGPRRVDGDSKQSLLYRFERVRARCQVDREPAGRPQYGVGGESGKHTGFDDAGLAASAGPHNGDKAPARTRVSQPSHEPVDEPIPTEEVGSINLVEGPQSLVGVLDVGGYQCGCRRSSFLAGESFLERVPERCNVPKATTRIGIGRSVDHICHVRVEHLFGLGDVSRSPAQQLGGDHREAVDV